EQLFGRIREIPAWGTLLRDGRLTQERTVAPRRLSTPNQPENQEIRSAPVREANANRPLTSGAPRNGLAQDGTVGDMDVDDEAPWTGSRRVPAWARPFRGAEPSGWVDASAARAVTPGRRGKGGALWRNQGGGRAAGPAGGHSPK